MDGSAYDKTRWPVCGVMFDLGAGQPSNSGVQLCEASIEFIILIVLFGAYSFYQKINGKIRTTSVSVIQNIVITTTNATEQLIYGKYFRLISFK